MDERTIGKQIILAKIIRYVLECNNRDRIPYINEDKVIQWFDENTICMQEMIYAYRGTDVDRMAPEIYNTLTKNDETLKGDFLLRMLRIGGDRFVKDYMNLSLITESCILDELASYIMQRYKKMFGELKYEDKRFLEPGTLKFIMCNYFNLFIRKLLDTNKYVNYYAIVEILINRFSEEEIKCLLNMDMRQKALTGG